MLSLPRRSFFKQVGIPLRDLVTAEDMALLEELGLNTPEMLDHPTAFRLCGDNGKVLEGLPAFIVQDMPHVSPSLP